MRRSRLSRVGGGAGSEEEGGRVSYQRCTETGPSPQPGPLKAVEGVKGGRKPGGKGAGVGRGAGALRPERHMRMPQTQAQKRTRRMTPPTMMPNISVRDRGVLDVVVLLAPPAAGEEVIEGVREDDVDGDPPGEAEMEGEELTVAVDVEDAPVEGELVHDSVTVLVLDRVSDGDLVGDAGTLWVGVTDADMDFEGVRVGDLLASMRARGAWSPRRAWGAASMRPCSLLADAPAVPNSSTITRAVRSMLHMMKAEKRRDRPARGGPGRRLQPGGFARGDVKPSRM